MNLELKKEILEYIAKNEKLEAENKEFGTKNINLLNEITNTNQKNNALKSQVTQFKTQLEENARKLTN